jgi:hypothetical protein
MQPGDSELPITKPAIRTTHNVLLVMDYSRKPTPATARLAAVLRTFLPCIPYTGHSRDHDHNHTYTDEKTSLLSTPAVRPTSEVASDVVDVLLRAPQPGISLRAELDSIVGTYGWTQRLAEYILAKLCSALQSAHENLGPAVRDAYHLAWEAAKSVEGFVKEHPVFVTVVALGVLVIIAPWVLEALGFAELGPIEGAFKTCCYLSLPLLMTLQGRSLHCGRLGMRDTCPRGRCSRSFRGSGWCGIDQGLCFGWQEECDSIRTRLS